MYLSYSPINVSPKSNSVIRYFNDEYQNTPAAIINTKSSGILRLSPMSSFGIKIAGEHAI